VSNSRGSQTGGYYAKEKGYSHDILNKRKRAKGSSTLKNKKGQKSVPQRKSITVEKKERLL
jgi:hypothetical protein